MRSTAIALSLSLLLVAGAAAQQPITPSHQRAAAQLIELLQLEQQTAASLDMMTAQANVTGPNPFTDIVEQFMREVLTWEKLQPEYVRLYAEVYTEQELHELAAFYRTPLGQRVIETTPVIAAGAMAIAQQVMLPHAAELQRRIMQRIGGG